MASTAVPPSTSTITATSPSSSTLKVIIEPNATVAQSSKLSLRTTTKNDTNKNNVTLDSNVKVDVEFVISGGNLFHPQSRITLLVPPITSSSTSDADTGTDTDTDTDITKRSTVKVQLRIGENNLLEEECHVLFDLSPLLLHHQRTPDEEDKGENTEKKEDENLITTTIMGSYNQFAPRSHVQLQIPHPKSQTRSCKVIGNGNIFSSMCRLTLSIDGNTSSSVGSKSHQIQNGNVFQPFVHFEDCNLPQSGGDDDDEEEGGGIVPFQEKVYYLLSTTTPTSAAQMATSNTAASSRSSSNAIQMVRPYRYGMKKNMKEVGLLLTAMRGIVQKHHRLLPVSK